MQEHQNTPVPGKHVEEIRLKVSLILTIGIVIIALSLSYFVFADIRKHVSQTKVANDLSKENVEIKMAKNTLYNNGIVSIMIANIDRDAQWKYFISNTGVSVVE